MATTTEPTEVELSSIADAKDKTERKVTINTKLDVIGYNSPDGSSNSLGLFTPTATPRGNPGPPRENRTITVRKIEPDRFLDNSVRTSKYTFWNFLYKNLFEQFRRVANIYFLIISMLQLNTNLSPTNRFATFGPLMLVMFFTMVKEAVEDSYRHAADRQINARTAHVLRDGKWVDVKWWEVNVADIVQIRNKEDVPADVLLFSSSGVGGVCYINTANLDGEDNLKLKQVVAETADKSTPEQLMEVAGDVEYEAPNADLYMFRGSFHYAASGNKIPLDLSNVVWRGSQVQNTDWVAGVVVYAGQETKLIMNSRDAPAKRSFVEKQVDRAIIIIFITLAVMCSVSTILHSLWLDSKEAKGAWYLPFLENFTDWDTAGTWITFLILYNNLVPISLYVSLEFVKLIQARLIGWDRKMYYAAKDIPAEARTSNLNEDLGQIEYIFSDKTGTLTSNEMEFKMCSVGGVVYGSTQSGQDSDSDDDGHSEHDASVPMTHKENVGSSFIDEKESILPELPSLPSSHHIKKKDGIAGYNFDDSLFLQDLHSKSPQSPKCKDFVRALAVCHTVIPEVDEKSKELLYKAASPDEGALVAAASYLGYKFSQRGHKFVYVQELGKKTRFDILNVNEFNSKRKRMSVVTKGEDQKIVLYCKGADDVMIPLLKEDDHTISTLRTHLFEFASAGLRTLVVAKVELELARYKDWNQRYYAAANLVDGREEMLAELAREIEQDMRLVGATAIEDKLQKGVPEAIQTLTDAGIKVWMLTGDKLETAQNIGFSCRLLTQEQEIVRINEKNSSRTGIVIAKAIKRYQEFLGEDKPNLAVVVTGRSLGHVFSNDKYRALFLQLIIMARVVVGCRVIPSQKAEIVRLVKAGVTPAPLTLSIGDGANDVAMIQEADVGIGIAGNEGMQAVRASDYSIGQFRFLVRLLLVHGRWNYRRVSLLILYSFYKNITNVLTLFYYGMENGYSGTTLYESWLGAGWNVGWTLFPILLFGVLEQDVREETALANPICYQHGQKHQEFNLRRVVVWLTNAVVHSLVIYGLTIGSFSEGGDIASDGKGTGLFLMGTMINFCTVLTVNYKIALETRFWTIYTVVAAVASLCIWFLFVYVYSFLIDISYDFFGVGRVVFQRVHFLLLLVLVPAAAIMFDLLSIAFVKNYMPSPLEILMELEYLALQQSRRKLIAEKGSATLEETIEAADLCFVQRVETPDTIEIPLNSMVGVGLAHDRTMSMKVRRASTMAGGVQLKPFRSGRALLVANEDNAPLARRVHLLAGLLDGDQTALKKAAEVSTGGSNFIDKVQLQKLSLKFANAPELESKYERTYIEKSLWYVRAAATVCFFLVLVYASYSLATDQPKAGLRLAAVGIGAVFLAWILCRFFREFYHETIFMLILCAGIARTLLVISNGAIGLGFFTIGAFLVFRARVIHALIVITIDMVFFYVYISVERELLSGMDLVRAIFLQAVLSVLCALLATEQEKSFRRDFLLQEDFEVEQDRTQSVIDNIMPRYITIQMRKQQRMTQFGAELFSAPAVRSRRGISLDVDNKEFTLAQMARHRLIANDEGLVSILFCNIVNFNELIVDKRPGEVVAVLDSVWSIIDELCIDRGVQKMETVGKIYMACAGIQDTRADHALACVELAEDIVHVLTNLGQGAASGLAVRIGVHTGKAMSGVVGRKRPQFSLFGDTVNTSSRMQSTGVIGQIHVSSPTYELLREDYECEPRTVTVKGKGDMRTYLVKQRLTPEIPSKHWEYVEIKHDLSIIDEAVEIVKDALTVHDFDPKNAGFAVRIKPHSLRFVTRTIEKSFLKEYNRRTGRYSRIPLVATLVLFFGEAFFDYFNNDDAKTSVIAAIWLIRMTQVVLALVLVYYSYGDYFSRHSALLLTIYYSTAFLGSLAVPLLINETLDTRAALIYIFLMTGLSNSGTVRFLRNVSLNIGLVLLWVLASFFVASDAGDTIGQDGEEPKDNGQLELFFFVAAAAVINAVAVYSREYYIRREYVLTRQLLIEKQKSEQILFDMLPAPVAEQIRLSGLAGIANEYEGVSILYSDIKGFTQFSAGASPSAVVRLLNDLFSSFDMKTDEHGIYKLQTIGDAYVCVSGLPYHGDEEDLDDDRDAADCAHAIVRMAMDMQDVCKNTRKPNGDRVDMRIGIHTGKILAGVVGTKQFRYDIWGTDCVVANSLESEGVAGGIVVSLQTHWYIQDRFETVPYKTLKIKGVADGVKTYLIQHEIENPSRRFSVPERVPAHEEEEEMKSFQRELSGTHT